MPAVGAGGAITVIVAEGAIDRHGKPHRERSTSSGAHGTALAKIPRVTLLGHVQRRLASAFDRNMSTMLGAAAVEYVNAAARRRTATLRHPRQRSDFTAHGKCKDAADGG